MTHWLVLGAFVISTSAQSMEPPKAAHNASQVAYSACQEATDGARNGEALVDRIERLEMQLRLSKAERKVRRK